MPKVKLFVVDNLYDSSREEYENILRRDLTEWEDLSMEDYNLLTSWLNIFERHLKDKKIINWDQRISIVAQDVVKVPEALVSIKELLNESIKRQKEAEEKSKAAQKKREETAEKKKKEKELKKLKQLQEKYAKEVS